MHTQGLATAAQSNLKEHVSTTSPFCKATRSFNMLPLLGNKGCHHADSETYGHKRFTVAFQKCCWLCNCKVHLARQHIPGLGILLLTGAKALVFAAALAWLTSMLHVCQHNIQQRACLGTQGNVACSLT